jgi:hypothetical protein
MIQPPTPRKSLPRATDANESAAPVIAENEPHWLRLDQLPGFMWQAIRAMGKSVFSPLTRTALDRIEVIADLGGNGPHSRQQIDAISHRLCTQSAPSNIVEYSAAELAQLFSGLYRAQAIQFETLDLTYLLVKDPMGSYIYRWPTADTHRHAARIGTTHKFLIDKP